MLLSRTALRPGHARIVKCIDTLVLKAVVKIWSMKQRHHSFLSRLNLRSFECCTILPHFQRLYIVILVHSMKGVGRGRTANMSSRRRRRWRRRRRRRGRRRRGRRRRGRRRRRRRRRRRSIIYTSGLHQLLITCSWLLLATQLVMPACNKHVAAPHLRL